MATWLGSLGQDLQYGLRNLRRAPALVVVSVLSLGLGIGLNLTLYAGVQTIFQHQPSMDRPEQVVGVEPGNGRQFSYENYRDLRDSGTFAATVGFRIAAMNRRVGDDLERVGVLVVTDNFFDGLGIRARLGRAFTAGEAAPERSPRVAVIDHRYWQGRHGANPRIVGETLTLDGEVFTIVGVLAEQHRAITGFMGPSIYVPVSSLTLPTLTDRGSPALTVLGRLAEGDTTGRAQARVTALGATLEQRFPEINEGLSQPAQVFGADAIQFRGTPAGFRLMPIVLLALFGLVLLIGSVNVAGLLLARTVSRRHELTLRSALGASRARVVQALLAESFLLAAFGASAGLGLMVLVSRSDWLGTGPLSGIAQVFSIDARLLLPAALLVAVTTLLCGAAPALGSTRTNLVAGLRAGATGSTARLGLRSAYVVGQVALSLVLLVVASLCWRSQSRIATIDLGFDLEHGVVARFSTETPRDPVSRRAFIDQVIERVETIPGVARATVAGIVPLGGDALVASFHPAGRTDIPGTRPSTLSIGPGYFATLAIPVIEGREFDVGHRADAPAVAIVNRTFAATYFPGRSAIGEPIEIGGEAYAEIIGVVRDSKIDTIGEAPKSVVYYPFAQRPRRLTVIARTSGDPDALVPAVRAAVNALDASAKVDVSTLREAASLELGMRRAGTEMVGAIGLVGVLLTAIGLYGVVSYLVASRTAELAIRMTLGATARMLLVEVVRHAARLVGAGIVIGGLLALLVTPGLAVFLAGISPADPLAFIVAAALLLLIALAASYIPARRVSRVDPLVALRD